MIGLLSLLGWFLPTLVAVTPLRNVLVNAASARLPKGIEVGSAHLSWSGPVELHDVRVPDEHGGNLLEVERIESENSLWELATKGFSRALFRVFRPKLRITMREHSTRVDSSVFRLLRQHTRSARKGRPFALDLENGLIDFVDERGAVLTEISDVTLTLNMTPGDDSSEGSFELAGRIVREDGDGALNLNADWSGGGAAGRAGHVVLDATRFPADALGPLLASRLDGRELRGEVTGKVEARWEPTDDVLSGDFQLDAERLLIELVSVQNGDVTAEPAEVTPRADVQRWDLHDSLIRASGQYDTAADHAALSEVTVHSDVVSLTASGEVQRVRSQPVVDLQGELTSDPEVLFAFLDGDLPQALQVDNFAVREFTASGPVSEFSSLFQRGSAGAGASSSRIPEEELNLGADVSWSSLDFSGIHSANGWVNVRFAEDQLQLTPIAVIVSGGRVESLPRLDFSSTPHTLILDEGPLVRDVAFTEEMCRTWLKYVSPLLADATTIEGRFSADSGGGTIPLHNPHAADVAGTLQVHAGRVGPGPLSQEIIATVEQVRSVMKGRVPAVLGGSRSRQRTWLQLPEQNVGLRVTEGRVYHDGMQYVAGDVVVTTRGSVGFDDTLDAVLEIPVQDDWLKGKRYLASLQGQTLEIPLRGTLDNPQVDSQAVTDLIENIAAHAGAGLLQQLFDR